MSSANYTSVGPGLEAVRTLACSEYLHAQSGGGEQQCHSVEVDRRTAAIITAASSISSLTSAISGLAFAPWLCSHICPRKLMLLCTLVPAIDYICQDYVLGSAKFSWLTPTLKLRFILLDSFVMGILAVDLVMQILSQSLLLRSASDSAKSRYLAFGTASNYLGMVICVLPLRILEKATYSLPAADAVNTFPFKISSAFCIAATLWVVTTIPRQSAAPSAEDASAERTSPSQVSSSEATTIMQPACGPSPGVEERRWPARLRASFRPLALLSPLRDGTSRDWSLVCVLIAASLCSQIGIATANTIIFAQAQFAFHSDEISALLGVQGALKITFLLALFPFVKQILQRRSGARYAHVRSLNMLSYESNHGAAPLPDVPGRVDLEFAKVSLLFDVGGWALMTIGGALHSLPTFIAGLIVYELSAATGPTLVSLGTILLARLPGQVSETVMLSLLGFLNSITAVFGPILNNTIYTLGLSFQHGEIVFAFTALVSGLAFLLLHCVHLHATCAHGFID